MNDRTLSRAGSLFLGSAARAFRPLPFCVGFDVLRVGRGEYSKYTITKN